MASSTLWFSVDGSAGIADASGTISTVAAYRDADGNAINAARVRIAADTFLPLYYDTGAGWETAPGLDTAILDGSSSLAWQPADLGSASDSGAMLSLELGYVDLEDEMSEFVSIAFAEATLATLEAAGHISAGGVSTQSQTPWSPIYYMPVPEPSAGLLLALGACMLALRRRPRTGKERVQ